MGCGITDEFALGIEYALLEQEPGANADVLGIKLTQVIYVGEMERRLAHVREWPPTPAL